MALGRIFHRFASWCLHGAGWWGWSWWELSWIVPTLLGAQQLGKNLPWTRPLFESYVAGAWFLYWTDDTLYWVAKPAVHVEPAANWRGRRLHRADGPAIESDAENLYFWHGVLVPAFVVVRPDWITAKHVLDEENAEVRRVMLERMGHERFVTEAGLKPIHADRFGELFRLELDGDEPLVVVRVVNSTPEPDGSVKRYLLRVHPELRPLLGTGPDGEPRFGEPQKPTARNAVASTFGKHGAEYRPTIET